MYIGMTMEFVALALGQQHSNRADVSLHERYDFFRFSKHYDEHEAYMA